MSMKPVKTESDLSGTITDIPKSEGVLNTIKGVLKDKIGLNNGDMDAEELDNEAPDNEAPDNDSVNNNKKTSKNNILSFSPTQILMGMMKDFLNSIKNAEEKYLNKSIDDVNDVLNDHKIKMNNVKMSKELIDLGLDSTISEEISKNYLSGNLEGLKENFLKLEEMSIDSSPNIAEKYKEHFNLMGEMIKEGKNNPPNSILNLFLENKAIEGFMSAAQNNGFFKNDQNASMSGLFKEIFSGLTSLFSIMPLNETINQLAEKFVSEAEQNSNIPKQGESSVIFSDNQHSIERSQIPIPMDLDNIAKLAEQNVSEITNFQVDNKTGNENKTHTVEGTKIDSEMNKPTQVEPKSYPNEMNL